MKGGRTGREERKTRMEKYRNEYTEKNIENMEKGRNEKGKEKKGVVCEEEKEEGGRRMGQEVEGGGNQRRRTSRKERTKTKDG